MRKHTALKRHSHGKGRLPFEQMQREVEHEVPPWEPPPLNSDTISPKPPFVDEVMQARTRRSSSALQDYRAEVDDCDREGRDLADWFSPARGYV